MSEYSQFKKITASDAKNNFGGLLEEVAALGGVQIVRHGRPVAVVLSARLFNASQTRQAMPSAESGWSETHMIPAELARAATVVRASRGFDED